MKLQHIFKKQSLWYFLLVIYVDSSYLSAQITLEDEVKITDQVLFFNGA
jgi:hypothetical protein